MTLLAELHLNIVVLIFSIFLYFGSNILGLIAFCVSNQERKKRLSFAFNNGKSCPFNRNVYVGRVAP
jgi:hypothetical protein